MERLRAIPVPINGRVYAPDGSIFKSKVVNSPLDKPASVVGLHEGGHIFLALRRKRGVKRATVIAGNGYQGLTETKEDDPVVRVGPSIYDPVGGTHDVFVARIQGVDIGAAKSTARPMIAQGQREIHKIAVYLDERGSASGSELEEAMNEGEEVELIVQRPDGSIQRIMEQNVRGEIIMFPHQEYVPQAA